MSFLPIDGSVKLSNKFNGKQIIQSQEPRFIDWQKVQQSTPWASLFTLLLELDLIDGTGQLKEQENDSSLDWLNLSESSLKTIEDYWQCEERLYSDELEAELRFTRKELIQFLIEKEMIDPANLKMVGSGVLQVCGYRYFVKQLLEIINQPELSIEQLESHLGKEMIQTLKNHLEHANDYDFRVPLANPEENSFQDLELTVREFFVQRLDPQLMAKGAQVLEGRISKGLFPKDENELKGLICAKFFCKPIDIFIGAGDSHHVDDMQLYRLGGMDLTIYKSLRRKSRFTKRSVELPMAAFFSADIATVPDTSVKDPRQAIVDLIVNMVRPSCEDDIDATDWLHAVVHLTKGAFLSESLENLFFEKFFASQKPLEKQLPYCLQHLPEAEAKGAFFWNLFASMHHREYTTDGLKQAFEKHVTEYPSVVYSLLHLYVKEKISFPLCQSLLYFFCAFKPLGLIEKGYLRINGLFLKLMEEGSLIPELSQLTNLDTQKKLLALMEQELRHAEIASIKQKTQLFKLAAECLTMNNSYLHQIALIWFSRAEMFVESMDERKKWLKVVLNLAASRRLSLKQLPPSFEKGIGIKVGSLKGLQIDNKQELIQSLATSGPSLLKELGFDFWNDLVKERTEAANITPLTLKMIDAFKKDYEEHACELINYLYRFKAINEKKTWQLLKSFSFKQSFLHPQSLIELIKLLCEHQKAQFDEGDCLVKILLWANSPELTAHALKQPFIRKSLMGHPEFQKLISQLDPLLAYEIWELLKIQPGQPSAIKSSALALALFLLEHHENDAAITLRILSSVAPLLDEKDKEKFSQFAKKIYSTQFEQKPNWLLLTKSDALELKVNAFFRAIGYEKKEEASLLFLQLVDEKALYKEGPFKERAQGWLSRLLEEPSLEDWAILIKVCQRPLFIKHFPYEYACILFSRFHEKLKENKDQTNIKVVQGELFELLLLIKRHAFNQPEATHLKISAFAKDYLFFLTHFWLPETSQHQQQRQLFIPYLSLLLSSLLDDTSIAIQLFIQLHTCQFLKGQIKLDQQILARFVDFITKNPIPAPSFNILILYANDEQKAKLVEWCFSIRDEWQLYQLLLKNDLHVLEKFISIEKFQKILHWVASTLFRQDIKAFASLCQKMPLSQLPVETEQFFHSINGLFEYSQEEIDFLCHMLRGKKITLSVCECLANHISYLKPSLDFIFGKLLENFSELPVTQVQKLLLLLIQQATSPSIYIEKVLEHGFLMNFFDAYQQKSQFYLSLLRLIVKDKIHLNSREALDLIRRLYEGSFLIHDEEQLGLECLKKFDAVTDIDILKGCWLLFLNIYLKVNYQDEPRIHLEKLACRLIKKLKKTHFLRDHLNALLDKLQFSEFCLPQLLAECLLLVGKEDRRETLIGKINLFCRFARLKPQWDAGTISTLQENQEELRQVLLSLVKLKSSMINDLIFNVLTDERGNIDRYFDAEKTLPVLMSALKAEIINGEWENPSISYLRSPKIFMRYLSQIGNNLKLFNLCMQNFFQKYLPLLREREEPLKLEVALKEIHKVWLTYLKKGDEYYQEILAMVSYVSELLKTELVYFLKINDHQKIKIIFYLFKENLEFSFRKAPLPGQIQALLSLLLFDISYSHLFKQELGSLIEPSFFSPFAYKLYPIEAFAIEQLSKMSSHPFSSNLFGWHALPKDKKQKVVETVIQKLSSQKDIIDFKCLCGYLLVFQDIYPDPSYLQQQYSFLFGSMRENPNLVAEGNWIGMYQHYKANKELLSVPFLNEYLEVGYHYFRYLNEERDKVFFDRFAIISNSQEAKERLDKYNLMIHQVFRILHEEYKEWGENYESLFHHIKNLMAFVSMAQMLEDSLNMTNPCIHIEINHLRVYELLIKFNIDESNTSYIEYKKLLRSCLTKSQLIFFPSALDISKIYDPVLNPYQIEYKISREDRMTLTEALQAIKEDNLSVFQQLNVQSTIFNFTQLACLANAKKILTYLAEKYSEQMKLDKNMTALEIVAVKGDLTLTLFLLEKSQHLINDETLANALGLAILFLPSDTAKSIFDLFQAVLPPLRFKAVCQTAIPLYELTVMHMAAKKRHLAIFKKLFDAGLPLNMEDQQGNNPLHFILEGSENSSEVDLALVKLAIQGEVDPLKKNHQNVVPLFLACQRQDLALLDALISSEGLIPAYLLFCIKEDNVLGFRQITYLFEEKYPQRKIQDVYDQLLQREKNLLHFASLLGRYEIVKEILIRGGHLSIRSQILTPENVLLGCTALEFALSHQYFDVAELILEKEIELALESKKDPQIDLIQSPLHLVANGPFSPSLLKKLLRWGCSLFKVDEHGDNPIHAAIRHNNSDLAKFFIHFAKKKNLLEHLINHQNEQGKTLLHLAAHQGLKEIILILLQNKACLLKDKEGNTAVGLARAEGHANLALMIDRSFEQRKKK